MSLNILKIFEKNKGESVPINTYHRIMFAYISMSKIVLNTMELYCSILFAVS